MHNSQHEMGGSPEQFYDPNNPMGVNVDPNANKTHTRFPNPARPGSVGNRERKGGRVPN